MRPHTVAVLFVVLFALSACSSGEVPTLAVTPDPFATAVINASPTATPKSQLPPATPMPPTQTAMPQPAVALVPVTPDIKLVRRAMVEANVKDTDKFHQLFDYRSFVLSTSAITTTQFVTLVMSTEVFNDLSKLGIQNPSTDELIKALGVDWLEMLGAQQLKPNQILIIARQGEAYVGGEFDFRTGPSSVIKVISLQRVGNKQFYRGTARTSGLDTIMWSDEAFERFGSGVVGLDTVSPWNVVKYFRHDNDWQKLLIPLEFNQERRALQRNLEIWDQLTEEQRYATLFGDPAHDSKGVLDFIAYVDFTDAQKGALRKSFELVTKIDGIPRSPDTYASGLAIEHPFTVTNMLPLLTYVRKLVMKPDLKAYWLNPSGKSGYVGVAYGVAYIPESAVWLNPAISSDLQMLMVFKEAATNLACLNFCHHYSGLFSTDSNDLGPTTMHEAFLDHYPAIYSWLMGREIEAATGHAIDGTLGQRAFFMEAASFQGK